MVQPVAVLRRGANGALSDADTGQPVEVPEFDWLSKADVRTFSGLMRARESVRVGAGEPYGSIFAPLDSRAIRVGERHLLVPELLVHLNLGFGKANAGQVVVPFGSAVEGFLTGEATLLLGEGETPLAEILCNSVILR